jgi:hypothetical protein
VVVASVVLYLNNPTEVGWFPPCPFRYFTGLDCPGCGSLRGLHSLLHGNILKAADYNLLLLPALPLVASGVYTKITKRGEHLWSLLNRPVIVLIVICAFWLARNIRNYPLEWLASGR